MVHNFKTNMNTIKATMALRHKRERKIFIKSCKKNPRRKYESPMTAPVEENLYFAPKPEEPEADC